MFARTPSAAASKAISLVLPRGGLSTPVRGVSSSSSSDLSAAAAQRRSRDPAAENLRQRRNLALSYRLMDRLGLNEGTCNHLTVAAPARDGRGGTKVMLLAPGELL